MRQILAALPLSLLPLATWAEVPKVVTDIPAVHSLTAQVMGDLGAPAVLLEQGGNAHNFQLRPSQAQALQEAQLVVWIGPDMTPWLARALHGIELGDKALQLIDLPQTYRRDFDAPAEEHDHDHATDAEAATEAAHDHDHDHDAHAAEEYAHDAHTGDEADHKHSGLDPHAWLDPANAALWLDAIAAQLGALDPDNGAAYAANATAAKTRIAAMDGEIAAQLAPVRDRPFITFHAAYGYFTSHYGLAPAGSVALGDAVTPGAAHLAGLQADLSAKGVVCAFPEAQHDPKQIALVIEGTPVRLGGTLDPSGSTLDYGPALYETLMRNIAAKLSTCLSQG